MKPSHLVTKNGQKECSSITLMKSRFPKIGKNFTPQPKGFDMSSEVQIAAERYNKRVKHKTELDFVRLGIGCEIASLKSDSMAAREQISDMEDKYDKANIAFECAIIEMGDAHTAMIMAMHNESMTNSNLIIELLVEIRNK
jgi:hypothetical protein